MLTQEEVNVFAMARYEGRHRLMVGLANDRHFVRSWWDWRHIPRHRSLIRDALQDAKAARDLLK